MCLAIPGQIVDVSAAEEHCALVDVVGVKRHISTALLADDPPQVGEWVLIHVGFAMSKISELDARDQIRTLSLLGEAEAARTEAEGYGSEEVP